MFAQSDLKKRFNLAGNEDKAIYAKLHGCNITAGRNAMQEIGHVCNIIETVRFPRIIKDDARLNGMDNISCILSEYFPLND